MLNLLYTSSKTLNITTGGPSLLYVGNADAFYLGDSVTGVSNYRRVYRDGTLVEMGTFSAPIPLRYDNIDTKDGVVVTLNGASQGYIIDRITWTQNFLRPIAQNLSDTLLDGGVFVNDRTGVRKYYHPNFGGYIRYDEETGVSESTVVVTASFTIDSIHFMRDQQICLFDLSAGRVFFYDVSTETVLLETSIEVAKAACFDTTYQNVVSIRSSDNAVQTYDSKPRPFKLSTLVATPGTYDRYLKEDISVTVLGSDDELITGIDVQWDLQRVIDLSNSINASEINAVEINAGAKFLPPKGKMTPVFSVTDENGVATSMYCPPGLDWELNDTEVIIPVVKM